MRIDEIVALDADNDGRQPLPQMAFPRKRIIDAVANYQPRIVEHAIKIIVFPRSRDIPHWRDEIEGWASYLSSLRVKTNNKPMGYKIAYEYLYSGAFGGNELGMTRHFVRMAELSHKTKLTVDLQSVHDVLKDFLSDLAIAIGDGKDVRPAINSL